MGLAAMAVNGVSCAPFDWAQGEPKMNTEMRIPVGSTRRFTPAIVFVLTLNFGLTSARVADPVNYC